MSAIFAFSFLPAPQVLMRRRRTYGATFALNNKNKGVCFVLSSLFRTFAPALKIQVKRIYRNVENSSSVERTSF